MADASFRDAEAVIDEVAMLESAIREAAEWRRGISHDNRSPGKGFDAAVASYGIQLRAWIDLQVDARLQQVLPGLVDSELVDIRSDSLAAVEAAERAEAEVHALADSQAKLLVVVEGISEEMARMKAALTACHLGAQLSSVSSSQAITREEVSVAFEKVRDQLDELKRGLAREQQDGDGHVVRLARHDETLAELRRSQDRLEGALLDVQRLHDEVTALDRRFLSQRAVAEEAASVKDLALWTERRRPPRSFPSLAFAEMAARRTLLPVALLALAAVFVCGPGADVFAGAQTQRTAVPRELLVRHALPMGMEALADSSLTTSLAVSTPGWWANIVTLLVPITFLIVLYLQSERTKAQMGK